ncbi:MAG: hypothetical protein IJD83_06000 [Clostridia bacterium]|nr:hypothetical protein [Clostridia bacterium]
MMNFTNNNQPIIIGIDHGYKDNFSRDIFKDSIRLTDKDLHEDLYAERSSIIRKLKAYRKQQQEQIYPKPKQKELDDELEM